MRAMYLISDMVSFMVHSIMDYEKYKFFVILMICYPSKLQKGIGTVWINPITDGILNGMVELYGRSIR